MKLQLSINGINKLLFGKYTAGLLVAATGIFMSVVAADRSTTAPSLISGTIVPKEVQNIIDTFLKDSTCTICLNQFTKKIYKLDPSLKLSDIEAGVPFQIYKMDLDTLMNENDSISIGSIAKPINEWVFLIRANGKYLYSISITKRIGEEHFSLGGTGVFAEYIWQNVREQWPESSGFNPIMIRIESRTFLHFPQIDDYNLYDVSRYKNDPVTLAFDQSTGENKSNYISPAMKTGKLKKNAIVNGSYLSDSRRIFKVLKEVKLDQKSKMKMLREMHLKKMQKDSLTK